MTKSILTILVLVFFLSGCVVNNIQKSGSQTLVHQDGQSYIVGSFLLTKKNSAIRLAIEIVNVETNKEYLIELKLPEDNPGMEAFEFPPGEYKLTNFVRLTGIGELIARHEIAIPTLAMPFELRPNEVVYVGNYDAKTNRDKLGLLLTGSILAKNNTQSIQVHTLNKEEFFKAFTSRYPELKYLTVKAPFYIDSATQQNESSPWK